MCNEEERSVTVVSDTPAMPNWNVNSEQKTTMNQRCACGVMYATCTYPKQNSSSATLRAADASLCLVWKQLTSSLLDCRIIT
ncbi:uncharacterized protein BDV17DRAFT_52206 [Aspergillus undulatus]|uniref:uncharacterized protein n=1 Tax=Aspergillus undulatus TaxID=1810928 RepID=UPI003CCCC51D